ncbi:hypothetical protein KI387_041223 [Taxus chinensis]|uniref:Uncharacterized protein n=1 Tax=Taxus chinensis TaxID=29808 RepID=A0AA38F8T3_TAXCH|nr:hypothetical protein KI387_041223 [Taxus chinensis]
MEKFKQCAANFPALTPIGFIDRAATVYGDCISIVYNSTRFTWSHTFKRCRKLASALCSQNISRGDVVSVVAPNVPAMYEMHFAVPMAGAVLNNINIRLDARTMAEQFSHCEPKFLFVDYQFLPLVTEALSRIRHKPNLVVIEETTDMNKATSEAAPTYEGMIKGGDPDFQIRWPEDEWQAAVLNYTSGTTSAPKGVVHCHRGLYAMAVDNLLMWGMTRAPVFLWTLPMFHGNGWCFPWSIAAAGGTNICLRKFDGAAVVARPDPFWGETPCAFVRINNNCSEVLSEVRVISFCRERMAHFMAPKTLIFMQELPKTSTGKVQKFVLREIAKTLGEHSSD